MKLGALNSAIRAFDGAPRIGFNLANRHAVTLAVQKGPMIAELQRVFSEGRGQETGLWLDADGFIRVEVTLPPSGETPVPADPDDDLIG